MRTIRKYQESDMAACIAIFESNYPRYFVEHERPLFTNYLLRQPECYFLLEVKNVVRACAGFRVDDYGISYLAWGMVHSAWHRQSFGSQLLEYRIEQIRAVPHAWCIVLDTTQYSEPFYTRHQFRAFRNIPNGYGSGLDKILMRKLL